MNVIIRYLFILTMLSFSIASSPNDLCFFRVYITNGIEDNIAVHVSKRGGEDLGNHTLAFNQEFDWKFGVVLFRTYYSGEFWWRSKHVTISVFNRFVFDTCFDLNIFAVQRCYWMVKPEGFYINVRNHTFADGWSLVHRW
ncbi:plant self-incompatibility S1 [Artemisia annua]|uniref:S-protein homolog n=1 Tax=Artemisia annua TaxID=35608 RepID=A0A2U1QIU8_ARTAN|nr:plant self-incompatibility S1 [Artemisia annua]